MKIIKEIKDKEGNVIRYDSVIESDDYIPTERELELTLAYKNDKIKNDLAKGIEIDGCRFTEQTLVKFITATDLSEKLGMNTIKWQKVDRTIVELTIQEARQIQAQGFVMFQNIYFN